MDFHALGMNDAAQQHRHGLAAGISAFLLWGIVPIYFKLAPVGALALVCHRVIWSALFMLLLVLWQRDLPLMRANLTDRRVMLPMLASTALISSNWMLNIWAVKSGHVLATSLGAFLVPLLNVGAGVIFLKEKMRPAQKISVAIACVAAVVMSLGMGVFWLSALFAATFAAYGFVRKTAPVGPVQGLTIETSLVLPLALGWIVFAAGKGEAVAGHGIGDAALLLAAGVITSVPLLLFAQAARALPMVTLGLLQYIAPSIHFLVGWLVYEEALYPAVLAGFVLIWIALCIYTWDTLHMMRRDRERLAAPAEIERP